MATATETQRQALTEAFGESSGSENEAHPQRRALAEVFGESSDSDGEAMSLGSDGEALLPDSENEALGESTEMENQSLEESLDSENEAIGESSDSKDEIEARTEAQRLAILEAFGESSNSENDALGESSEMENQSLEESPDSENEAFGESSDNGDEIEARAEAQRLAILEAFGESSDSEDEIEAHPSSNCDAESKRRALIEAFGESSDSENEALLALRESSDNQDEAGTSPSSPVCGLALARKSAFEDVSKADSSFHGAKARRFALVQAFGETSDSEGEIRSSDQIMELGKEATSHKWEIVEGIKGLWVCRDFLSAKHQSLLMQAIQREGWFQGSNNNQGMRFGNLPEWATELSRSIWEAVCFADVVGEETTEDSCMEGACPLPVDILSRVPLFDQLIINVYQPGEGICAHVDLMRFDDGIAIVSLESSCVMHFTRCEQEADATNLHGGDVSPSTRIAVYLTPGSLVVLSGEARYLWKHEINRKPGFQLWEEREIKQEKRTSVTLRKLLQQPDES